MQLLLREGLALSWLLAGKAVYDAANRAQAIQHRSQDWVKSTHAWRPARMSFIAPWDEIATAIARCAGCLADSVATGGELR